jgi:hypothetical protein
VSPPTRPARAQSLIRTKLQKTFNLACSSVGQETEAPSPHWNDTYGRRSTELPQESEAERLRQDQLARERMAEHMQRVQDAQ